MRFKNLIPSQESFEGNIKEIQNTIEVEDQKTQPDAASEEKLIEKRSLDEDVEEQADVFNLVSYVILMIRE